MCEARRTPKSGFAVKICPATFRKFAIREGEKRKTKCAKRAASQTCDEIHAGPDQWQGNVSVKQGNFLDSHSKLAIRAG
jgi:hypothetical protein